MAPALEPRPIYLDQNVYSRLQHDDAGRARLLRCLHELAQNGMVFVYSWVHVEECRASEQPDAFSDILDELPAYFLEASDPSHSEFVLTSGRARELILAERDLADEATRRVEDMLKLSHFASGWLDEVNANGILNEITSGLDPFWASIKTELPTTMHDALRAATESLASLIQDIPLQNLREESQKWQSKLRARLPQNFAQLDAIPAKDVVAYLFSQMDDAEQRGIEQQFPPGFWLEPKNRKDNALSGFAFMLFLTGIVRDRRVGKKGRKRREKHFLGQFRDCTHIEEASRCAAFLTCDAGAARLAKAVYAYAGVPTSVMHLTIKNA